MLLVLTLIAALISLAVAFRGLPLADYGLTLAEERLPQSSHFRDGFLFKYTGGEVAVDVEYSDLEYVITFSRDGIRASYLFLDENLFNNRSSYHGNMFPRDKLRKVVAETATDIQQNYQQVLRGDELTWKKIEAMSNAPTGKSRLPP